MGKRRIAVITVSRADWGPLRPIACAMQAHEALEPLIIATGGHLDEAQGRTAESIEAEGFEIAARVATPEGSPMATAIGAAVDKIAEALRQLKPDAAVVLGDRFETLAAATAAYSEGVAIVHLHGGEITAGAADNRFRYAITALADLHVVATARARRRLMAMGEAPERVVHTGAPGLDDLVGFEPMPRAALLAACGLSDQPFALVAVHPETVGDVDSVALARVTLRGVQRAGLPMLITGANADPGGRAINECMRSFAEETSDAVFTINLGADRYRSAMAHAAVLAGNSSSGIIEAASLGLRVVNVGERQAGRERSGNVIDVPPEAGAISDAVSRAIESGRYEGDNVYGDGSAGARAVDAIASLADGRLGPASKFEPPSINER